MKIYTKQGDTGTTSIVGGRVPKHDIQVEVIGIMDELNSYTGLAMTEVKDQELYHELLTIQHELFDCGSDLSFVESKKDVQYKVTPEMTEWLETRIDHWMSMTPPIKRFILPGGTKAAASLHVCRTITRKAERMLSKLQEDKGGVPEPVQRYLNRLSDYFFAIARVANNLDSTRDVEYIRGKDVFTFSNEEKNK